MNLASISTKPSWTWIVLSSAGVSAAGLVLCASVRITVDSLLVLLFTLGIIAGGVSVRQAWLSGLIVGIPFAMLQLARQAVADVITSGAAPNGSPWAVVLGNAHFWRLAFPTSILATSLAVAGALTGAWLRGTRRTQ